MKLFDSQRPQPKPPGPAGAGDLRPATTTISWPWIQETAQRLGLKARRSPVQPRGDLVDWIQDAYGVYDGIVPQPRGLHSHQHRPLGRPSGSGHPHSGGPPLGPAKRGPFAQISAIRPACAATFMGLGIEGVPAGDGVSGGQNQAGTAYIACLILILQS